VKLHPVTVMLGLLAGGTLAGFWGVLLAVPSVAAAKIIMSHLWQTRVLGVESSPYAMTAAVNAPSVVPETDTPVTSDDGAEEDDAEEDDAEEAEDAEEPS
jgi:hypothetical protein